jgi:hypothetical protein
MVQKRVPAQWWLGSTPEGQRPRSEASALGAFCLFEPRGARICPGNLRYICSDNGNASQGADNTSVRAEGGVLSVRTPRFSTFLNILRSICSCHGAPARRAAATAAPTVHRGRTHAPRLQQPVASDDVASACSELRLGCHPETPVIEPCRNKFATAAVAIKEQSRPTLTLPTKVPSSSLGQRGGLGRIKSKPLSPMAL